MANAFIIMQVRMASFRAATLLLLLLSNDLIKKWMCKGLRGTRAVSIKSARETRTGIRWGEKFTVNTLECSIREYNGSIMTFLLNVDELQLLSILKR